MPTPNNADDLKSANHQINLQNKELEKYSAELISANKKLDFRHKEKENRESELAIANVKLTFENNEKEKRAAELAVANKKLRFENKEKEKREAELAIANEKLQFENNEKKKRAEELAFANNELKKAEIVQQEHLETLKEIMFIISHKIRKPLANIIGICNMLEHNGHHTPDELKKISQDMMVSAESLNEFTKELSTFIYTQRKHT